MAGNLMTSIVGLALSHWLHVGFYTHNNQVFYRACNESNGCTSELLPGCSANNFKPYSSTDYATDGNAVFFRANRISGADVKTFRPLARCWAGDHSHLFRYDKLVSGADPSSFRPLFYYKQGDCTFGADHQHVIVGSHVHPACDARTLRVVPGALGWQVDKRCVYFDGMKISQVDPHTITAVLTPSRIFTGYVKDRSHVYFMGRQVPVADAKTFRMISSRCAKDHLHHYDLLGDIVASC